LSYNRIAAAVAAVAFPHRKLAIAKAIGADLVDSFARKMFCL
jgi:hypothetical protein